MEADHQPPKTSVPEQQANKRKRLSKGKSQVESMAAPPPRTRLTVGASVPKIEKRAAQCTVCGKWWEIPTVEAYEVVRANATKRPFVCEHASASERTVTCTDDRDISPETDESLLWALDEPNIPVTPAGWQQIETIRKSRRSWFSDVKYIAPPPHNKIGFAPHSPTDIGAFLGVNPEYVEKGVRKENFSFKGSKPLRDGN